jgi:signal transduction histidine kinase
VNEPKERILVVDDDTNLLLLLTKALEREDYEVQGTPDSLAALEILKNSAPFSLLLTDLMMPKLSGLELLQRARELDPYLEIIVITAAGSIESTISAMRDGGAYDYLLKPLESITQLAVVAERAIAHRRLILERAELQQRMESDAKRLQALIANVSEGILAAADDGTITVSNSIAEVLLGKQDLVGQDAANVLPPKLFSLVENWLAIGSEYPAAMEITWPDDSIQMVSLAPLTDHNGKRQGWAMVLRDITAIKRLDKLKTQALLEAISKLRMPMAEAMNAVVDLNLRGAQDERLAGSLFRLTNVWERIQSWRDELLSIVQTESEWNVQPRQVDANKVLEEVNNDRVVRFYRQGGGKIEILTDEQLPTVRTDPDMLYRLLQDLIKRATMRNPQNGEIRLEAREKKDQVWIEISDDGPPANDADLLQVFDKNLTDTAPGFLDIGLDLVRAKSMLDRLDGQLWVSNQPPRGSTITICLPTFPSPAVKESG